MTDATGKLARGGLRLLEFDFEFIHQAGIKHQMADTSWCWPATGMDESSLDEDVPVLTITEGQPEGEETTAGAEIWHSFYSND